MKRAFAHDLEDAPAREGMGHVYGEKYPSDYLAPLFRYLRGQVGRPWNKVWSELCARISRDSTMQRHVIEHVFDVVARHVTMVDGRPHHMRWGKLTPLTTRGRWSDLYVCPRTGLLREAPRERPRPDDKAAGDVVALGPDAELRRIEGVWYEVRYVVTARGGGFDLLRRVRMPDGVRIAASKRQLGRREIALRGL